jgi:phage terminase small subunit
VLLEKTRDASHMRLGSIAVVKVFLETLKERTKRHHWLDPWERKDMFRLNQRSMRDLDLVSKDDPNVTLNYCVEYLNEHKFNCYLKDQGYLVPVLFDAEVYMNPTTPDSVIVRTDSEQYKVDFFIDQEEQVTQLDYEKAPFPYVSRDKI